MHKHLKTSTKAASKTRKLHCKARRTISAQNPWSEWVMHHKLLTDTKCYKHLVSNCFMAGDTRAVPGTGCLWLLLCAGISTEALQVQQCQPGCVLWVSLASKGSWVHLECSGEGYLAQGVGGGWGRAVGRAEATGELPLVNKESARRLRLGLKHKININTIILVLF